MNKLLLGAVAGASGTMALDIVSYADMALQGRAPSTMPADVIRRIAARAGISSLSAPDEQSSQHVKNRRSALGALSGYAVGLCIGVSYAAAGGAFRRAPLWVKAGLLGALALAAADIPAMKLGATDLRTWGVGGWMSDIVPHVAYGLVTAAAFDAMAAQS